MIYWSVITIFLKYLFTPLAIFHYPSQPPFPTPLSIFYTCQPQPFACHCQVKLPVIYGRDSPQMANYTKTFPATISGRPPRPPFTPPLGHLINLPSFRRPPRMAPSIISGREREPPLEERAQHATMKKKLNIHIL